MVRPRAQEPPPAPGRPLGWNDQIGGGAPVELDDAALIERAKRSKSGASFSALWAGDITGYKSRSEADIALCNALAWWTNGDAARVDSLFRQSGLMREKWDRPQSGSTYGALTIQDAVSTRKGGYDPQAHFRQKAEQFTAPAPDGPLKLADLHPEKNDRYAWNDIGNGNLFADWYKEKARYVPERKKWFVYNGRVWEPDPGGLRAMELCKRLADALVLYALGLPDGATRDEYAVKMGAIRDNPCSRVTLPAPEYKEKEVYTLEETQHFLDSLEGAPLEYQAFFTLAIFGGFRRGELLGLEWPDVDLEAQTVTVRRTSLYTKERGTFTDTTKTRGSQRTLKLPANVFIILRRYRAEQAQRRLLMGDRWTAGDRLFTNADGGPAHPNTPYHWLQRFCQKTGQRFLGIHAFRHLNASLLIESGADVRTVAALLGHSQAITTMNIYAHSFEEAQARAGEAVGDLLGTRKRLVK